MKRYVLFRGETYYPGGGWHDFVGAYDSIEEARGASVAGYAPDWWHVIDITSGDVVAADRNHWEYLMEGARRARGSK